MSTVLRGPYGQVVLGAAALTVGRTPDNQLVVNDPKVSSRQAEIRLTPQGYTVTDLGSSSGTFVDGQRLDVNVPRLLMPGDTIRFGDTTFVYEVASTPVNPTQWSGAENQPNLALFPPSPASYAAPTEYVPPPPPPPEYSPYVPGQSPSYMPPAAPYPAYGSPLQPSYNPYTPLPSMYNPPPQVSAGQQASSRGPQGGRGRTILLVALAVLVILAGAGLFAVIRSNQVATENAQATATAHANAQTATVQANLTATVVVQMNATATFVANPYIPNSGSLALFDPLIDNSKGHRWDEGATGSGHCQFAGGTYRAVSSSKNSFYVCFANTTNFGDFTYQADLKIVRGDCGGLVFRADSASFKLYSFEVCQDGTYDVALYTSTSSGKYLISRTTNAAIKTGLNQVNVIAVVANSGTIQLYVNNTSVDHLTDSTLTGGEIGVSADDFTNVTEVSCANVKVWT